jgi:hypothetical protein
MFTHTPSPIKKIQYDHCILKHTSNNRRGDVIDDRTGN